MKGRCLYYFILIEISTLYEIILIDISSTINRSKKGLIFNRRKYDSPFKINFLQKTFPFLVVWIT